MKSQLIVKCKFQISNILTHTKLPLYFKSDFHTPGIELYVCIILRKEKNYL